MERAVGAGGEFGDEGFHKFHGLVRQGIAAVVVGVIQPSLRDLGFPYGFPTLKG